MEVAQERGGFVWRWRTSEAIGAIERTRDRGVGASVPCVRARQCELATWRGAIELRRHAQALRVKWGAGGAVLSSRGVHLMWALPIQAPQPVPGPAPVPVRYRSHAVDVRAAASDGFSRSHPGRLLPSASPRLPNRLSLQPLQLHLCRHMQYTVFYDGW